jgi:hypothetical protein
MGNPQQAQAHIDGMQLCAPCTADHLEQLSRKPAEIALDVRFDRCGHNDGLPCHLCRVGVASAISLLWSYARLNGETHAAHRIARLRHRLRAAHGHLFHMGQHPHEQPNATTLSAAKWLP